MGSGETSPTMVTPHQQIVAEVKSKAHGLVVLDSPFGFQENADELVAKISDYFLSSVGAVVEPVKLRKVDSDPSQVAHAIAKIRDASWVFAGPGSPSYALRVWQETGVAQHLEAVLERGALVLASAAALTAGSHTVAVYEIYKVGADPTWLPGLDILGRHTGLNAAVIPHFDNTEGANHDTRFCYMGERRLAILEAQLPPETFILGVDEHTGVSFDLDEKVVRVFGRGVMTIRRGTNVWKLQSGKSATFAEIAQHAGVPRAVEAQLPAQEPVRDLAGIETLIEAGEVPQAVQALLQFDATNRTDETRAIVHSLISRIGELAATPKIDLRSVVSPYVEALLVVRNEAREANRWDQADVIRDLFLANQIAIKDSAQGTTWEIS